MKKIILLPLLPIFLFISCEPLMEPRASFDVSKTTVETFEDIKFFNSSREANYFEWDFGDGYVAYDYEPVHHYSQPGRYTVRLAAYNHNLVDYSYFTIVVTDALSTLSIQVLEYYQKYPVTGASIIVYPTFSDWSNEKNSITEITTDQNGIAIVRGLAPGYYYLDIWEQHHNNYALANEDINFIRTPYLLSGETTYFDAYVDYVAGSTKSKPSTRKNFKADNGKKRIFVNTVLK